MAVRSKFAGSLLIGLALAPVCGAKPWRGIVPLRSTRADVERLLGPPIRLSPPDASYDAGDARVFVSFSEGDCNKWPYGWDVPAGVVESIHVSPVKGLLLSELDLDRGRFREALDVHYNILHLIDDEEGFTVSAFEGGKGVSQFVYTPTARERHRDCYENVKGLPKGRPRAMQDTMFDSYGYVSTGEENKHLDGFAGMLLHDPEAAGYIFGYAGRRAYAGEGRARAERAKRYVVETYAIDPGRVWAVEGGHHEYNAAELYVLPAGGRTPRPNPNIPPSGVQILGRGRVKQSPRSRPR